MRAVLMATVAAMPFAVSAAEVTLPLPVTYAEVFPGVALVELSGAVELPAGNHQIHTLLPEVVVARAGVRPELEGAVLTGVSVAENTRFDPAEFDIGAVGAAREARDADLAAVEALERELAALRAEMSALDAQDAFLRSVTGGDTLASAEELVAVAATVARELAALAQARAALEAQVPDLEERLKEAGAVLARSEAALAALGPAGARWQLVTLDVAVAEAGEVSIAMPSAVEASWSISYVVSLDEEADRLSMDRNVKVNQFGALPWVDTVVKLSTADPGGQLAASRVGRSIARVMEPRAAPTLRSAVTADLAEPMMEADALIEEVGFAGVDADGAVIRYDLPAPVTLMPGAGGAQVALAPLEFEAEHYLEASPRLDDTAFVTAEFTNDQGEPILPGEALIYRGATLIGSEFLPLIAAGAEEALGFGPERSIALETVFLDQQSGDRGVIRGQETREDRVRLVARNLGDAPQEVRLRYAVPSSQQEDLEIRVEMAPEPGTRDADDLIGVMEWDLSLAPRAVQEIELSFDLRWPEGQVLNWRP